MTIKTLLRTQLEWARLPALARIAAKTDRKGVPPHDPGPEWAIEHGLRWLGRAQDRSASHDGGVARHFSLIDGWSTSYPETTGYIVPTMIHDGSDPANNTRALRMLDWLVSIQFPEGGFQGGMVHQTPRVPVTFNTGQILMGLAAGVTLDERFREPMIHAADWLVASQDADGAWRKHHSPFATHDDKTYYTHVAWGLMDADAVEPGRGYLKAALANVDWAITRQAANGWMADCCLDQPTRPLTHTLGYTLRGFVEAYLAGRDPHHLSASIALADGLISALPKGTASNHGALPGRLDAHWRPASDWVCLTGASQIAHSWLLLHKITSNETYLRAALAANAFVRRCMTASTTPDTEGGVKGSFPVDGGYGRWQFLNWACKFTIDANRAEIAARAKTQALVA